MMNQVALIGRLVRDASLKYSQGGLAICEFSLAVNDKRKKGEEWVDEAHFFDVTLFGRRGEALQQYLTKGKQIGVSGKLQQSRWTNQEGQNRSKVSVIALEVTLIGSKNDSDGSGGNAHAGATTSATSGSGTGGATTGSTGDGQQGFGEDDFPDGIPF